MTGPSIRVGWARKGADRRGRENKQEWVVESEDDAEDGNLTRPARRLGIVIGVPSEARSCRRGSE